jgi:DNA-binding beta-propeller fold protein YncE
MALNYASLGNYAKALSTLEQALKDTPWLDPASEADFKPIAGCPSFKALVAAIEKKYPVVSAATPAFTIQLTDLIPEGLAADPVDGSLYMSSIYHRKIVKISPDGKVSDFIAEGQDGILSVLGLKVDPRDRSVWAASERLDKAALFHFDSNGKTLAQYLPEEPGKHGFPGRHGFNDLVITPSGQVLVTDSTDNSVYSLPPGGKKLVRYGLGTRAYPNGIALSPDGTTVYVAHAFGIARMNVNGTGLAELSAPAGISLAQVDGLYFWNGGLLAIQNGYGPNRIVYLPLAPDGNSVTAGRLLEFRSSNLDLPTTGAILNGSFYYMVNTQIDHEQDGKLKNPAHLQPVRIAVLKLR